MISLIVAQDINGLIGSKNKLPWKIKEEMKHFTLTTWNSTLLMGRSTYESLPVKSFKNRKIIVLSRRKIEGVETITKNGVFNLFKKHKNSIIDNLFICGGKQLYEEFYTYAKYLIISTIKKSYEGDTYLKLNYDGYLLTREKQHDEFFISYYERDYDN